LESQVWKTDPAVRSAPAAGRRRIVSLRSPHTRVGYVTKADDGTVKRHPRKLKSG